MTGHIAIAMPTGADYPRHDTHNDLVLVMTILDRETMRIPKKLPIAKLAVNTGISPYSGMLPQMTFRTDEIVPAPELVGMGAAGILREPIWAIKKYKGIFE